MATTRIHRSARNHLYIAEWLEHLGLSDEKVASRIGVHRTTIWKWAAMQSRLRPDKLKQLADACGNEMSPEDFYHPPGRISIDAMTKDFDDDQYARAIKAVRRVGEK